MRELFRRLFLRPWLAWEIFIASFFLNLLFLASPIYVIQILSRYIPYGFSGTLVTLTVGMVLALVLLFLFTVVRNRLASAVSVRPDRELEERTLETLARARTQALQSFSSGDLHEMATIPQAVQPAFDAVRINSVMDMPFFLLFLLAVLLLSPALALLTLLGVGCNVVGGWLSMERSRADGAALQQELAAHRGLVASAVAGAETVRAFRGRALLREAWAARSERIRSLRWRGEDLRNVFQSSLQGLAGLLRVAVYAFGAYEVVLGDLSVGALIGASILSGKAMQIASQFMQSLHMLVRAEENLKKLAGFFSLPLEPLEGSGLKRYSGRLQFQDVAFAYPGSAGPLFESLNFLLEPGRVLVVLGRNGAGKTTLVRLVTGLLQPSRGHILADGVDLRQLAPDWWRGQLSYMPQEPSFLNATIRENILLGLPGMESARLNAVVRTAGLRQYLDMTRDGLETRIEEGGRQLPLGIRKRLALARALAISGPLVVLDEPTDGLDDEGCTAVYAVMNAMVRQGASMVVVTRDSNIIKGAALVLDLGAKPVPELRACGVAGEAGEAVVREAGGGNG
ncbi:MAG: ATP-binding cassette domain-containing protein [Desulfovibrio sp.]